MSTANNTTPSLRGYVHVFNKTTGETKHLQPQVHPLLAQIQAEYDMALALRELRQKTIAARNEALARVQALFH